jgi:hypothetical protein
MLKAEINRNRKIGCEFECFLPKMGSGSSDSVQETLASILTANGLSAIARPYSHVPVTGQLAVECDASIVGRYEWQNVPYAPIELKTKILNGVDEFEQIVPKALQIVTDLGGRVNYTCGFHIHLSLDEVNQDISVVRSLFNLFFRFEPVIYGLIAPSRSNNEYCRPLPLNCSHLLPSCKSQPSYLRAIQQLHNKNGLNLFHLTNGNYLSSGPRVEFRYHQGTLEIEKARSWLTFCLQMLEHACKRNCQFSKTQVFNDRIGLEKLLISCGFKVNNNVYAEVSPELRDAGKWLIARWRNFNGSVSLASAKKVKKTPGV